MACVPRFTPPPKSAPGDFYVEKGQCLACGVPHVVAPDLVGWTDEKVQHLLLEETARDPSRTRTSHRGSGSPRIGMPPICRNRPCNS